MNHDPADIDGDGEFDAIDIVILEEGKVSNPRQQNRNTGCCLTVIIGVTVAGAAFTISKLII
jgi:hypothetical protein